MNKEEICMIDLTKVNRPDDEYYFYSDGTIKNKYDQPPFNLNQERWLNQSEIDLTTKKLLLDKCPSEHKQRIAQILELEI